MLGQQVLNYGIDYAKFLKPHEKWVWSLWMIRSQVFLKGLELRGDNGEIVRDQAAFRGCYEQEERSKRILMDECKKKEVMEESEKMEERAAKLEKELEKSLMSVVAKSAVNMKDYVEYKDSKDSGRRQLGEIFGKAVLQDLCLNGGAPPRGKRRGGARGRGRKVIMRRGAKRGRFKGKNDNSHVKLRRPGQFAPDSYEATLVWVDTNSTRTGTGTFDAINWCYRTSAYDPDPSVLTGAIPGFVELANLYGYYRVISMRLFLDIATAEVNQSTVVVWPSNVLNSVNSLTKTDLMEVAGNPFARSRMTGINSVVPVKISTKLSPKKFLGNVYYTDESYASTTSSSPANMLYMNIGLYKNDGSYDYATPITARVLYKVRFYGRRQLFSITGSRMVFRDANAKEDSDDEKGDGKDSNIMSSEVGGKILEMLGSLVVN